MDFEPPDSEDEQRTEAKDAGRGTKLDRDQAPPLRLPDAWTSLSAEAQAAVIQRWSANPGLNAGTPAQRSTPARIDAAAAEGLLLSPTITPMSSRPNGL